MNDVILQNLFHNTYPQQQQQFGSSDSDNNGSSSSSSTTTTTNINNFIDIDTGIIVGSSSTQNDNNDRGKYYTIGQGAKLSGVTTKYYV